MVRALSQKWKAGIFFDQKIVDARENSVVHEIEASLQESGIETDLHALMPDYDPNQLISQLQADAHDFYVVVASSDSNLLEVMASLTKRPVFGVMLQPPVGLPALSVNPANLAAVAKFLAAENLKRIKCSSLSGRPNVFIEYTSDLSKQAWFQKKLEQALQWSSNLNLKIDHGCGAPNDSVADRVLIIKCIHFTGDIDSNLTTLAEFNSILVPFIEPDNPKKSASTLSNFPFLPAGGIWAGLNGLEDAISAAHRLWQLKLAELVQYRGSVKDIIRPIDKIDELIFEYSDRYSVFDWGPMPDEISGKGEALAVIADQIFKALDIPHHSRGISRENPRRINVAEIAVLRPEKLAAGWDYSKYQTRPVDTLVPLEVIFRFGVPPGSSLPRRLQEDPKYMRALGLERVPDVNVFFSEPLIEFSTKLEDTDRYLSRDSARQISGMSPAELSKLEDVSKSLAVALKKIFGHAGFDLWDGKFEFAFVSGINRDQRRFMLVDSIGPDELRLTYHGIQISKQILRQYYADSEWLRAVHNAKKAAEDDSTIDWRGFCVNDLGQVPLPLSPEVRTIAENIYPVIANSIAAATGSQTPFPTAWDVSTLIDKIKLAGLA